MKNTPTPDLYNRQARRTYIKPILKKVGTLKKLTHKTGSQFDALTSSNTFAP
jgi:hypothetical protein